ncbi:hypothetical protein ACFY2W_04195 [Streptomyces sp. NPDC001262]|uniref:hypothetical protein n=1 Tax=unclassified Streptomyces TaxID=2593676 RepID=UPI0036855229
MTTTFRTRTALCALAAVVGGTLLTGCSKPTEDTASYTVDGQIASLKVKSAGGAIELVGGSSGGIKVTEKLRYSDDKPKTRHVSEGGVLTLTAPDDCGGSGIGGSTCEVSYRVEVPKGLAANLQSDGGNVTVDGGAAGQLTVRSDGGSISVGGFTSAPEAVTVNSSGGNVTLRMPDGSYAVDAVTNGGSQKVGVKTDPGSGHRITARTDGGQVSVVAAG